MVAQLSEYNNKFILFKKMEVLNLVQFNILEVILEDYKNQNMISQTFLQLRPEELVPFNIDFNPNQNLFFNLKNKKIYENKVIKIHNHNYQTIRKFAEQRKQVESPILSVYGFKIDREIRNGVYILLFIQYPKHILQNLKAISFSQALYILQSALLGMNLLIPKFGYFSLSAKMITINFSGKCKIWINQRFQDHEKMFNQISEEIMVIKLINLIEEFMMKQISEDKKDQIIIGLFFKEVKQQQPKIKVINEFIDNFINFHEIKVVDNFNSDEESQNERKFISNSCGMFHERSMSMQSFRTDQRNKEICSFFDLKKKKNYCQQKRVKRFLLRDKLTQPKVQINVLNQKQEDKFIQNGDKNKKKKLTISLLAGVKQNYYDFDYIEQQVLKLQRLDMKVSSNETQQTEKSNFVQIKCFDQIHQKYQQNNIKESRNQNRTKSQNTGNCSQLMEKLIAQQKLQRNQWKKKLSQLMSCQKNLNESVNIGQDEISYLKDFELPKLANFGRVLSTSLIQLQEMDEENNGSEIQYMKIQQYKSCSSLQSQTYSKNDL